MALYRRCFACGIWAKRAANGFLKAGGGWDGSRDLNDFFSGCRMNFLIAPTCPIINVNQRRIVIWIVNRARAGEA